MGKPKRAGLRLDMTAMVDVAFLLLTFFMLTTQFKPPQEVEVVLPVSHAEIKLPPTNIMTISVAANGRTLLEADSAGSRTRGIPIGNEEDLRAALVALRVANPQLRTVIRADQAADYGVIEDVMEVLKDALITRFSLVTSLESDEGAG